jgi:hypothetical protein
MMKKISPRLLIGVDRAKVLQEEQHQLESPNERI